MLRTLLVPSLLLLLLAAACFTLTAGTRSRAAITVASADELQTLDPGQMSWAVDIRAAMGLWEGLTAYEPHTLRPIPGVAQSWEISPDARRYTFHLRPDARWSDGTPVTAADFAFAWQRNLRPATHAPYRDKLLLLRGAQAWADPPPSLSSAAAVTAARQPALSGVAGIIVRDPRTLIVELEQPCTYFLDLLAFPPFFPLHEAAMRPFLIDGDPAKGYRGEWTRSPNLVSNGPFRLTDWSFKRHLLLQRNENYWDVANVHCPSLRLVTYDDPRAFFLAYQSGIVDVLTRVPEQFAPELLEQVRAGRRHDVQFQPVFGTYYYLFNCQKAPFNDVRVRKAFALAIDKSRLVAMLRLGQRPLDVLVPPDAIAGYSSPRGVPMNVPEAQRLLAAAGYPAGQGLAPVEILFNNEAIHDRIAQVIGQMWGANLGVRVTYRGVERGTFGTTRKSQDFAVARGGWYGDYVDPTTWLNLAYTGDGDNDGRFSSPRFDALLDQAAAETDAARRLAILADAERILVEEEFPFIPLYQYSDGVMYDPDRIDGAQLNVRNMILLKYLRRK
jgi:oligopeptide transport system substrate-binding protein